MDRSEVKYFYFYLFIYFCVCMFITLPLSVSLCVEIIGILMMAVHKCHYVVLQALVKFHLLYVFSLSSLKELPLVLKSRQWPPIIGYSLLAWDINFRENCYTFVPFIIQYLVF